MPVYAATSAVIQSNAISVSTARYPKVKTWVSAKMAAPRIPTAVMVGSALTPSVLKAVVTIKRASEAMLASKTNAVIAATSKMAFVAQADKSAIVSTANVLNAWQKETVRRGNSVIVKPFNVSNVRTMLNVGPAVSALKSVVALAAQQMVIVPRINAVMFNEEPA